MIRVNGDTREFEPMTVAQLLVEMAIDPRGIAVALNGEIVSRSQWNTAMIESGDSVEIVTAAAGG
jgi:sulfur carrier protein